MSESQQGAKSKTFWNCCKTVKLAWKETKNMQLKQLTIRSKCLSHVYYFVLKNNCKFIELGKTEIRHKIF